MQIVDLIREFEMDHIGQRVNRRNRPAVLQRGYPASVGIPFHQLPVSEWERPAMHQDMAPGRASCQMGLQKQQAAGRRSPRQRFATEAEPHGNSAKLQVRRAGVPEVLGVDQSWNAQECEPDDGEDRAVSHAWSGCGVSTNGPWQVKNESECPAEVAHAQEVNNRKSASTAGSDASL